MTPDALALALARRLLALGVEPFVVPTESAALVAALEAACRE